MTLLAMGAVFELPVVMMMLGRVGILRSSFMRKRWREAVVVLAVFAAILPGTDPVTMTAEYVPMLVLYWLSYFLVKAVEPKHGLTDFLVRAEPVILRADWVVPMDGPPIADGAVEIAGRADRWRSGRRTAVRTPGTPTP